LGEIYISLDSYFAPKGIGLSEDDSQLIIRAPTKIDLLKNPHTRSEVGPNGYPLITVDPSLVNDVSLSPLIRTPPWDVEIHNNDSVLWLGHGAAEGISAELWATENQVIQSVFQVEPGPARPDHQRTVEMTLENQAGVQRARRQFDQATKLTFINKLQPGRNSFQFTVLDEATILKQPNGDTRSLLVLLRHVRIAPLSEP
jgi:hypothetical protein